MSRAQVPRVQSITRAFAVLNTLRDGPFGVTDVAERVRLPKSTAARLLGSLAGEGLVEQVPGETRYRLGPAIAALAGAFAPMRTLTSIVRPHLEELAEWAGEVAGLSVRDGDLVHYVDQVDSPNPVGVRDWTGTRIPMHAVSSGIVLLAHALPSDVERVLSLPLLRFTPETITDPAAVRRRIRQAQLDGFAWTRDEYADGITSVAAAVADRDGEVVAAVHLHGPSYRFPGLTARPILSERIVSTAARLTERLRGKPTGAG